MIKLPNNFTLNEMGLGAGGGWDRAMRPRITHLRLKY